MTDPYNPLEHENLAASMANALLETQVNPLKDIPMFDGAGIYAIYYIGREECYERLAEANRDGKWEAPIYTGKAVPAGSRKGGDDTPEDADAELSGKPPKGEDNRQLRRRLMDHRGSVRKVTNLDVDDFYYRALVVDPIWIGLGEAMMIKRFMPVWNALLDGFGNHGQGGGRDKQVRSPWDTLHPGRPHAMKLQPRQRTAEQYARDVKQYLAQRLP